MSDQREAILARACDLYLANGLDGFSMRKLAKAVGVTAPALYRHYDGKEAVLADVVREAHREFMSSIYHALEAPTPLERLQKAFEGYLDFALGNPRTYGIMFSSAEQLGMEKMPDDIEAMGCAIHQFWIDRVGECMRAGILTEGVPHEAAMTMWAHAHGMVHLFHQGMLGVDDQGFRTLVKESGMRLMAGVATDDFAATMAEWATAANADLSSDVELHTAT